MRGYAALEAGTRILCLGAECARRAREVGLLDRRRRGLSHRLTAGQADPPRAAQVDPAARVAAEQFLLRGVRRVVGGLAVRAGRREVRLHERRDARADGRGAVGVARALAVPGRRAAGWFGERVTEARRGRMRQEAVDATPGRALEEVDVDVAALLVVRHALERVLSAEDGLPWNVKLPQRCWCLPW